MIRNLTIPGNKRKANKCHGSELLGDKGQNGFRVGIHPFLGEGDEMGSTAGNLFQDEDAFEGFGSDDNGFVSPKPVDQLFAAAIIGG